MGIKKAKQYFESLRKLHPKIYMFGEKVKNVLDNPILKAAANAIATTYELANDPKYEDLMTATSHLTGEKINRFTHIHQSTEDLVKKIKMLRVLGQKTGTCFQRCVGFDGLNTLSIVTYDMDQKLKTGYYERFNEYLKYVQKNDLMCALAMTDVKGNRGLRPSQQANPDLYLRVVEKREDGIIVRGAKCHITGAAVSNEIITMPCVTMREEDKDYAVSFAVPADTDGVTQIIGRKPGDLRRLEGGEIDVGNLNYGPQESLIIFDDVFVPWNRVFMCGEFEFTRQMVIDFAGYHRQSYGGCKTGVGDVLIGATALVAEYNGVGEAKHVKDKITEMIHLNETMYSCSIACSAEGEKMPSGTYLIDLRLANVSKLNVTRFPYEMARLAHDIAGGLIITMPSEKDLRDDKLGRHVSTYLQGVSNVPTEHRIRIFRLIENITLGTGSVYLVESMHGAGSPQTQRIMIRRMTDVEQLKKLAKDIAGIREEEN